MHGFVDAAVESEVVLVGLEAREAAEDTFIAGLLVDSRGDRKIEHWLHFAGTDLEESILLPRGVEIYTRDWCHS
jgi:hypothetical protein